MFVACCPPSPRSLKLDVVRLTGCGISNPTKNEKTRLCMCLTVLTRRSEHLRINKDALTRWNRSRRFNLERSVPTERLKIQRYIIRELLMLPRQLQVTSVDGPRYTAAGGVGWLRSFVRESVVETGETAAGGLKLNIPYHHSR